MSARDDQLESRVATFDPGLKLFVVIAAKSAYRRPSVSGGRGELKLTNSSPPRRQSRHSMLSPADTPSTSRSKISLRLLHLPPNRPNLPARRHPRSALLPKDRNRGTPSSRNASSTPSKSGSEYS